MMRNEKGSGKTIESLDEKVNREGRRLINLVRKWTGASLIDVLRKKRKASSHSWGKKKHGYRLHNRRKESAEQG